MKPASKMKRSATILGLALVVGNANAATLLASYIDGNDDDANALVNKVTPTTNYTASDLSLTNLGSGTSITITTVGAQATPGSTQWLNVPRTITNTSTPTNANTNFMAFSLTADVGNLIDLTSLTFDAAAASDASNSFQFFYQLYASTDNSTFTAVGGPGASPSIASFGVSSVVGQSIDLTSLADAPTYYFQMYLGDNATTGTKAGLIQNMQLNGAIVAVPEPSTALLGAMGVLFLLRRRR